MDLIQMAREMGKVLQASEEYKRLNEARLANDNDAQLQADLEAFQMARVKLSAAMQAENRNDDEIKRLNAELKSIYTTVMGNPNMLAFNVAKQELDDLLNGVTAILMASVNGEDPDTCEAHPSSCGGDCGSCGGCH